MNQSLSKYILKNQNNLPKFSSVRLNAVQKPLAPAQGPVILRLKLANCFKKLSLWITSESSKFKCHGLAPVFERTKFVYYIYTYYTWFCALLSRLKLFIRLKKLHNACLYLYLLHEHLMHSCYTICELCCYLLYVPIGHEQLEGIKRNTI